MEINGAISSRLPERRTRTYTDPLAQGHAHGVHAGLRVLQRKRIDWRKAGHGGLGRSGVAGITRPVQPLRARRPQPPDRVARVCGEDGPGPDMYERVEEMYSGLGRCSLAQVQRQAGR